MEAETVRQMFEALTAQIQQQQTQMTAMAAELQSVKDQATTSTSKGTGKGDGAASSSSTMQPLIDTRLMNKPESFSGKEEDWPSFSLTFKAFAAATDPGLTKAIERAGGPIETHSNDLLSDEIKLHSSTISYILVMILKGRA